MNTATITKNQISIEKQTKTNLEKKCKILSLNNAIKEHNLLNSDKQKHEKRLKHKQTRTLYHEDKSTKTKINEKPYQFVTLIKDFNGVAKGKSLKHIENRVFEDMSLRQRNRHLKEIFTKRYENGKHIIYHIDRLNEGIATTLERLFIKLTGGGKRDAENYFNYFKDGNLKHFNDRKWSIIRNINTQVRLGVLWIRYYEEIPELIKEWTWKIYNRNTTKILIKIINLMVSNRDLAIINFKNKMWKLSKKEVKKEQKRVKKAEMDWTLNPENGNGLDIKPPLYYKHSDTTYLSYKQLVAKATKDAFFKDSRFIKGEVRNIPIEFVNINKSIEGVESIGKVNKSIGVNLEGLKRVIQNIELNVGQSLPHAMLKSIVESCGFSLKDLNIEETIAQEPEVVLPCLTLDSGKNLVPMPKLGGNFENILKIGKSKVGIGDKVDNQVNFVQPLKRESKSIEINLESLMRLIKSIENIRKETIPDDMLKRMLESIGRGDIDVQDFKIMLEQDKNLHLNALQAGFLNNTRFYPKNQSEGLGGASESEFDGIGEDSEKCREYNEEGKRDSNHFKFTQKKPHFPIIRERRNDLDLKLGVRYVKGGNKQDFNEKRAFLRGVDTINARLREYLALNFPTCDGAGVDLKGISFLSSAIGTVHYRLPKGAVMEAITESDKPLDNSLELDYRDFYNHYLKFGLPESNNEQKAFCPFHTKENGEYEDIPSLNINFKNGKFFCFSCQTSGYTPHDFLRKLYIDSPDELHKIRTVKEFEQFIRFGNWREHEWQESYSPHASFEIDRVCKKDNWIKKNITHTETYTYESFDKNLDGKEIRYEKTRYDFDDGTKSFKIGDGRWSLGIFYREKEMVDGLNAGKDIFIVEGERKVDLLRGFGLIATCLDTGANSIWNSRHTKVIRENCKGSKFIVLPDNDVAGKTYAGKWQKELDDLKIESRLVELPIGGKEDIIDYFKTGHTLEEFLDLVNA